MDAQASGRKLSKATKDELNAALKMCADSMATHAAAVENHKQAMKTCQAAVDKINAMMKDGKFDTDEPDEDDQKPGTDDKKAARADQVITII
jgi:hypothetical protein